MNSQKDMFVVKVPFAFRCPLESTMLIPDVFLRKGILPILNDASLTFFFIPKSPLVDQKCSILPLI